MLNLHILGHSSSGGSNGGSSNGGGSNGSRSNGRSSNSEGFNGSGSNGGSISRAQDNGSVGKNYLKSGIFYSFFILSSNPESIFW